MCTRALLLNMYGKYSHCREIYCVPRLSHRAQERRRKKTKRRRFRMIKYGPSFGIAKDVWVRVCEYTRARVRVCKGVCVCVFVRQCESDVLKGRWRSSEGKKIMRPCLYLIIHSYRLWGVIFNERWIKNAWKGEKSYYNFSSVCLNID